MPLTISLSSSGTLIAEIPGAPPHSVEVPFSLSGLAVLRSILESQAAADKYSRSIGFPACPTQAMINVFLATHRVDPAPSGRTSAQLAAAKEVSRRRGERLAAGIDLELDLSDLELDL